MRNITLLLMLWSIVFAECENVPALASAFAHPLFHSNAAAYEPSDTAKQISDTSCSCHPSLPLEILSTSIIAGIPAYWGYRAYFDDTSLFRPEISLIPASILLYMVSLAPVAEWSSGCVANWWNALWIGFGSNLACTILYDVAYGHDHILNFYKINWPEYIALGVAPTVAASFVYNLFLHPKPSKNGNGIGSDEGMYILPSINGDKSVALNFRMRF